MSYILDALKKSEKERIASTAASPPPPALAGGHHAPGRRRRFAAIVMLLLTAGLILVLSRYDERPAANEHDAAASAAGRLERPPRDPGVGVPAAQKQTAPTTQPASLKAQPMPESTSAEPARALRHAAPQPQQRPTTPQRNPSRDAPAFADLPPELQQALPPIHIEGHIYDPDPAARMAIINGRLRREGERLANGLILERITPSGVILSMRGARFRMGLFAHGAPSQR